MSHSINCRVANEDGDELVNMRFRVHSRKPGDPKLPKLYSNFDTVEGDASPTLLPEDVVLEASTYEAEVLNLETLTALFAARGRSATDETIHIHRNTESDPYVCWAGFTSSLEQMLTIVKAWTVFNAVNATAEPPIDPNQIENPLDLIGQFKLQVEMRVEE